MTSRSTLPGRLRIGIHLEALWPCEIGGAERHLRQLIEAWPALDPELRLVLALAPYNADTFAASPQVEKRVLEPEAFRALDAASLADWQVDVWFCPLLTLEPPLPGVPSAVVIPDLQHETYPEHFSDDILAWRRQHYARSVRDADRVITVSEHSRSDILARFGDEGAGKVVAVHHGPAGHFSHAAAQHPGGRQALRERYGLEPGYLLYPAHGWPHKNHETLFRALARLAAAGGTAALPRLVLTGGGADPAWPERWRDLGIEDAVRHLGHVPDGDMPALYGNAAMLVFPSRFEGFGLPVLEAMTCGCPVLCAATTSLPEVGGDAVAFADCEHPEALAGAIRDLLADSARRSALAERGLARAERFSAERAARQTLGVLRELAARPPLRSREAPPITVITPSYQQAAFLGRTLDSVIGQGYPRLQYLVVDGGSTDGSVALLEDYRRRYPQVLDFVSEPDGGQADAVNKGLARAEGAIIGWLNSDDLYLPGALAAVAEAFTDHPARAWLYGRADHIDAADAVLGPYPVREPFDWHALAHNCYLCQPAVFWSPTRLGEDVRLDPNLDLCMDYDLWIRLGGRHQPLFVERVLAASRVHAATKTLGQRARVFEETIGTVKRHYGYAPVAWAAGRAHHLWQPEDDPLFPGRIATGTWLLAALLVVRYNPTRPGYVVRAWGELLREARSRRQGEPA